MSSSQDDWRHKALCRDESPDLFHPVGSTGPALLQIEEAKAVCRRCSVTEACGQWAMDTGQSGVWGGLSEDERRALKRRNRQRARAS
jgi:WhiB family redox-sensing transcriptional regulator